MPPSATSTERPTRSPAFASSPLTIAPGEDLEAIVQAMGARYLLNDPDLHPERYMDRPGVGFRVRNPNVGAPEIIANPQGRPRLVDRYPHPRFGPDELRNERLPRYLFRAIAESDWEQIQATGFIQSDGRMNLMATEGTVASFESPTFYLPGRLASNTAGEYPGRIIRIRYRDEDGWTLDRLDGYAKTAGRVPVSQVDLISPRIVTVVVDRPDGYTNMSVRIDRDPMLRSSPN